MIQLSFVLERVGHLAPPAPPLRLTPVPGEDGDVRVTGVWPHRDLAAARRQLATWLTRLPPEAMMRCALTGRRQPIGTWVEELRAPPSVANTFEARHAITEGRLLARLFGLYQLGESDVVLVADPDVDVADVYALLSAWAAFRLASPEEPRWDKPFPFGYGMLSFADHEVGDAGFWALLRDALGTQHLRGAFDERMSAPAPRVLIEAEDLGALATLADPETPFVVGATQTLRLRAAQRETAQRLGASPATSPNASDAAGACDRLPTGVGAAHAAERVDFFAYREASQGPIDSGWRFGCLDPSHQHDAASFRIAPLAQLAAAHRGLERYLALPAGWVVTFEEGRFWTTAPGTDQSHPDTEPVPEGTPA